MGHNTGNDLNSSDILDFSDNCVNLDTLMNSDEDYWVDRFNNKKPTIDYALRMAGFTPAGFDFTTGGVLKNGDRNKCVFNQADQTWYSWSGDLPYNVIAGSVPGEGWKVVNKREVVLTDVNKLRNTEPVTPISIATVLGYHADTPGSGGGIFYHDPSATDIIDDGVLTFVTAKGKVWKRLLRLGDKGLSALDAGARPDSGANLETMTGLSVGTDNSQAQKRADDVASKLKCNVFWPSGQYRFTEPLQRKVMHTGTYTYASEGTVFILDNSVKTTWLGSIPGRVDNRSHDISGIWFVSAQLNLHRLFSAGFYRGSVENSRVSRFDIGFDIDGVYVWFKKVYFDNNNKGVYPRALGGAVGLGDASTMFGFEDCVFFGNTDIGFHHEVRPEGVDAASKELLSVQFIRCGFEYNRSGLVMTGRCWYVSLLNCWSEGNSVIGVNINNSFSDVSEMGSRWDDITPPVFPQNRHFKWGPDGLNLKAIRRTNYRNTNNVLENKTSSIIIKQDGTLLNTSGLPVSVSVDPSGMVIITFTGDLNQPLISVTPVSKTNFLSYSLLFDKENEAQEPANSNRVNVIKIKTFDPANPSVIIKPLWWNIAVSWPSNVNV